MSNQTPTLPQINPTRLTKSHSSLHSPSHTKSPVSPRPLPALPGSSIDIAQLTAHPLTLPGLIVQRATKESRHV